MRDSPYSQPLPLPKAALRRRLEVFSPKLARRASLGSYDAWRCWVALEANPAIERFCERPARVAGPGSAQIDFWVQLKGRPAGEFWLIQRVDAKAGSRAAALEIPVQLHGRPHRTITAETIASWSVPLSNWAQMLPYLASYRGHRDLVLEQAIVVLLARPVMLADIATHFASHPASQVRASLYGLVAAGRVLSPDLAVSELCGSTRFRRA